MEFLMARDLKNALSALRMEAALSEALGRHGVTLDDLYAEEIDPALGNGGLGRLAACFLDSMANLGLPGSRLWRSATSTACSVEELRDGNQIELPRRLARRRQSLGVPALRSVRISFASAAGSSTATGAPIGSIRTTSRP